MRVPAYVALPTALWHCVDGFRSDIPRSFSSEHLDSCTHSPVARSVIVYCERLDAYTSSLLY